MSTGKLKNVIIILLGILTIYQTCGLWFEAFSIRNLFYSVLKNQDQTQVVQTLNQDFTTPKNIIVGYGNKNFNQYFMNEQATVLKDKIDESILYLLKEGQYLETKTLNWDELLSNREIICSYSTSIAIEDYATALGSKHLSTFNPNQDRFDRLVVVPARGTADAIKGYFVNTSEQKVVIYSASTKKTKLNDALLSEIDTIQKSNTSTSYVSTYLNGLTMFNDNVFVPQTVNKNIVYPSLKITKADIAQISAQYIDIFLENPAAKWGGEREHNGVYMFSDEKVVVRYYPSGLLEYYNYEFGLNNTDDSFKSAFKAASELIPVNPLTHEDMYLSSVTHDEDLNTWRFGFDYYVGDYPVVLAQDLKKETGLEHMIEIVVKKGVVSSYKGYACDIEVTAQSKTVNVDFLSVINNVMTDKAKTEISIDNMYLAYEVSNKSVDSGLVWVIDMNQNHYIEVAGVK